MQAYSFETLRIILVVLTCVLRLGLMPHYLQSYLNMANDRIQEQKKESGRISNKELQKQVRLYLFIPKIETIHIGSLNGLFVVLLQSFSLIYDGLCSNCPYPRL